MLRINTGKGSITVMTLIAVWSISLVVDLPGLAVTPIMSQLDTIFPHASQLEIQLLSMLPNFIIIPFILLSGKLSMSKNRLTLIVLGNAIFLAGGIACFFAKSILALIVISCVIGVGCGLVIPLAAGVIAEIFVGVERVRQMGIKSGIANFTLIFATLAVGWLGARNWHLPFVVYLVPIIPIILSVFLTGKYLSASEQVVQKIQNPTSDTHSITKPVGNKVNAAPIPDTAVVPKTDSPLAIALSSKKNTVNCIWGIIAFYLVVTVSSIVVSYYLPFMLQHYGFPDSDTSVVTSIFFLFITAGGFLLPHIIKAFRNVTTSLCLISMIVGLLLLALFHTLWIYIIAVILIGFGYGTLQPIFYTKASLLSPDSRAATRTLSYVMTASYFGTAVSPLIFSALKDTFHIEGQSFTFWISLAMLAATLVVAFIKKNSFVFFTSLKEV